MSSGIVPVPELEVFALPGKQNQIKYDIITEHRSLFSLSSSHNVEFVITSAKNEFIKLNETDLYVKLKVKHTTDDATGADWNKFGVENNLLNSLFSNVRVYIGNNETTFNSNNHAYRAWFEAFFGTNEIAKETGLAAAGWSLDSHGAMNAVSSMRNKLRWVSLDGNKAEIAPKDAAGYSIYELKGKILTDLALQDKAIIGGTTLKIELIPNNPKFFMHHDTSIDSKIESMIEFEEVTLHVHRAIVKDDTSHAISQALTKPGVACRYAVNHTEVKSFVVQKGVNQWSNDNVCLGQLPRRISIALVSSDAYAGNFKKNPFEFKNYGVSFMQTYFNGIPIPNKPYEPNYGANRYSNEYMAALENLNLDGPNPHVKLTREMWKDGYNIYPFNFAPDLSEGAAHFGHVNDRKTGALRVLIKFKEPLTENVNVICFAEYDNVVYIDENRQGFADYNKLV